MNNNWKRWDEIALTEGRQGSIHPSGNNAKDYFESGLKVAKEIMKYNSESILEYGCGDGRILKHLHCKKLIGVDASENMLLNYEGDKGTILVQSSPIAIFDKSITADLIFTCTCFIHMTLSQGRRAFINLSKHLNPGGIFLFDIPIYDVEKENGAWNDISCWTEQMLFDAAKEAGLKIREYYTNPGEFAWDNIGEDHGQFHVLYK